MNLTLPPKARATVPSPDSARRGFTLIELMVALTGSLFFTIFVFMLSRDVSRFFQAQSRTSDTTLATIAGFERLRTDIARAGFLASPNLSRDVNSCPRPVPNSPQPYQNGAGSYSTYPGLQAMGLLGISQNASLQLLDFYATYNSGKMAPKALTLYGNYISAEEFPVNSVNFANNPVSIQLEQNSPALLRVGIGQATSAADGAAILARIFRTATILRVSDETGRDQYVIIAGSSYTSGIATLTVSGATPLIQKGSGNLCGLRAHAAGVTINPVNIIRYEIADIKSSFATNHPQLTHLFDGAAPDYESTRLELMRYELPATLAAGAAVTGVNWPGTANKVSSMGELVAEYAVDLAFGLTVLSNTQTGALTSIPETASAATFNTYAGVPYSAPANGLVTNSTTFGPHFIRGVHARLSVRYREADRDASVIANPTAAEQLIRVHVGGNQYARTRSLRGHIAMRNTQNSMWN